MIKRQEFKIEKKMAQLEKNKKNAVLEHHVGRVIFFNFLKLKSYFTIFKIAAGSFVRWRILLIKKKKIRFIICSTIFLTHP